MESESEAMSPPRGASQTDFEESEPEATLKFLRGEVEARLPKFRRLWRSRFERRLQVCFFEPPHLFLEAL